MKAAISFVLFVLATLPVLGADEVRIEKDVAYLGENRAEKLDFYFPPGHTPKTRAPAVLIIHGGGWVGGDKAASREINIGTNLARAGYVCASINYVLGKKIEGETFADRLKQVWPHNLDDCQTAVRFLRSHADEYGINPDRIGAIGGSAGGHLTAILGYTNSQPAENADVLYPGVSSRVQAVVPMYGAHDLVFRARETGLEGDSAVVKLCHDASPVAHLDGDDPPTLILHGTEDKLVALNQAELLAEACRQKGVEFQLKIVDGGPHSFHLQPKGHDLRPLVISFFDRHLKGKQQVVPRELKRERLSVLGRPAFIIWPTKPSSGPTPWLMYAPTLGEVYPGQAEAWMFRQFLDAGIAIAGADVGESYGSPAGREIYSALHRRLTEEYGFAEQASLLGRSRGGLMVYSWAVENPEKVCCIAGVYPVCNLASYPGLQRASGAYKMSASELESSLASHNPVDRAAPLAKANIPIYHIHGDIDKVVPLEANSALLKERIEAAGGKMEINIARGQGHNMWNGFFQCEPLVDFVISHTTTSHTSAKHTEKSEPEKRTLHSFKKFKLTDKFWAEGAHYGDFNHDGATDVVIGPYWYAGPDYQQSHEYYPATNSFQLETSEGAKKTVPGFEGELSGKNGYSNNFLTYTYDFNSDGWKDILVYGWPGKETIWYENPQNKKDGHWTAHIVWDETDNESPQLADITGDGKPELLAHSKGRFGYVELDWNNPTKQGVLRAVSEPDPKRYYRYTHGIGYGDINGDGLADLLERDGWWRQPANWDKKSLWEFNEVPFAPEGSKGGAQMLVYDFNQDGLNDVVTSHNAHGYGLSVYLQYREGTAIQFREKRLTGSETSDSPYGVRFSQIHALSLADIDQDGLLDIVTGKRFWAHGPTGDVEPDAPAVLYWFKTSANAGVVEFTPHKIDDDSGVGTQVTTGDLNGDSYPDIVVGNKKGAFVFLNLPKPVSAQEWQRNQPKRIESAREN